MRRRRRAPGRPWSRAARRHFCDYFGVLSGGGVLVVVELLLPGVVLMLPGIVVVDVLPVDVELSGVVVVPTEPLAPGVPVVLLVPIPVVVSVVPLDGLVVWSVELPIVVDDRGLVVDELLSREVDGPARPSGERLRVVELSLPTPVPLLGEVVLVLP